MYRIRVRVVIASLSLRESPGGRRGVETDAIHGGLSVSVSSPLFSRVWVQVSEELSLSSSSPSATAHPVVSISSPTWSTGRVCANLQDEAELPMWILEGVRKDSRVANMMRTEAARAPRSIVTRPALHSRLARFRSEETECNGSRSETYTTSHGT